MYVQWGARFCQQCLPDYCYGRLHWHCYVSNPQGSSTGLNFGQVPRQTHISFFLIRRNAVQWAQYPRF